MIMVLFCALPIAALAQIGGSIDGTVTDPNGGVVPAAKVTATNVATGVATTVATSAAGVYVFPVLAPGPYTIRVEQGGFKTLVREGIEVRLALSETIDLKLELGTVQQQVEVKAQAPVLNVNNATIGMNMSPQTLDSLPVWFGGSMRLANAFMGYMPSVQSNGQATINGSAGRATEVMIDGGSIISPESGGISFYFPGMEPYAETKIVLSGLQAENGRTGGGMEFFTTKSGTNDVHGSMFYNFERQIFNANSWSGNQNTAASNFVCFGATQTYACRPKVRYNDEGGSAGGPVWIPHVYDGRNKTFWFFTWEGYWQPAVVAQNTGETVATAAEVQGNFAGLNPIYDPATTGLNGNAAGVRSQFPNNVIPTTRFSTISKNFIPYIPGPNSGGGGASPLADYYFNQTTTVTDKDWSIKIDHSLGTKNHFSFFETHRYEPSALVQYLPGPISNGLTSTTDPHQFRASWDWVASPHLILHSYWSGDFDNQEWNNPLQNGFGCKLGFTELPCGTNADATPQVIFQTNSYTGWGMNQGKVNNGGQRNHIIMEGQALTWIHDKHEFKMGWEIRRSATLNDDWSTTNGTYDYNQAQTAIQQGSSATGDSFASFLLGDVNLASQGGLPVFDANIRYAYTAGYFQDTWKVKPNLTFNLGLRYEVPIGWHYVNGTYSAFSPTAINEAAGNLPGAMIFMGNGPGHIGALRPYPTDFTDVGPRGGFAWQVTHDTVIRGAFGLIYEGIGNGGCGCTDGYGGVPFSEPSDGFDPAFQWDKNPNGTPGVYPPAGYVAGANQTPGVDNFGSGNPNFMGPNFGKAPRIYDYNFTVQRQYKGWLFQVGYVGQRTHSAITADPYNTLPASDLPLMNLPTARTGTLNGTTYTAAAGTNLLAYSFNNAAQATVLNALGYYAPSGNGSLNPTCAGWTTCWTSGWGSASTLSQALRPFPQMTGNNLWSAGDGNGWLAYDSLQFIVEHRFGDLNLESSYVHSKNMTDNAYIQIFGEYSNVTLQDPNNFKDGKTLANSDYPNMVNFTFSYLLPFGRGKKFLGSANGAVNKLVGGWTLAGVGQYRAGNLIEITNPTNYLNTYLGWDITKATYTGAAIKTGIATDTLDPDNPSTRWFNTNGCTSSCSSYSAAFATTGLGVQGNQSIYNTQYRNPWFRNENLSLNKLIGIWNEGKVSLRYTLYVANPFQRTDFGSITTTLNSANYGRPGGAMDGARQMSMGLRLYF
jgi:hypothetical protein